MLMDGQTYSKLTHVTLSGNTQHAKCVGCILSSGIENVDVDPFVCRAVHAVFHAFAGNVLGMAAARDKVELCRVPHVSR